MAQAVLDRLGWAYVGIAIAWTVALASGLLFLHTHRHLPGIRMRRLPVLFTGVISLHIYGIVCIIGYVIGPLAPCSAEFWIMSIYLPFGIAMFHAANSQFLHIASRQKQYAHANLSSDRQPLKEEQAEVLADSRRRRILRGVERADRIDRMMVLIGVGLVIQLLLTLLIFFGSKKFHPSYGLWEWTVQGTDPMARVKCSRGWEWWLSIVWQMFWSWLYGPYCLWKSRGIHDVHGWRLQTICCCIAGLPASPLWLTGLYAPQMAPVNAYFVPPAWFSVSIFFMEVITIGFPIFQVFKTNALRQETLDAIASWEKRQQLYDSSGSLVTDSAYSAKSDTFTTRTYKSGETSPTGKTSFDSQKSEMFTMVALENALRTNPTPLLQFAALKDFSGENVSFLTHLAEWRRAWFAPKASTAEHRRKQYVAAVRIYAQFVSLEFSEFPINISSREMKNLYQIFEGAANMLFRNRSVSSNDSATPFDNIPADSGSTTDLKSGISLDTLGRSNLRSVSRMAELGCEEALAGTPIPDEFVETVFDAAESEIKYLVLTNTWPKFVNAGCEAREQQEQQAEQPQSNWLSRTVLCSV